MLTRARIRLYYDIVSPYSYIAFETLTRYAKAGVWNFDLELCPTSIGGVQKVSDSGRMIPASHPLKYANMQREIPRLYAEYGIRGELPPNFPNGKEHRTLEVVRLLRVLKEASDPKVLEECSRRLFDKFFGDHDLPGNDPVAFMQCLVSEPQLLSQSAFDSYVQRSVEQDNKKRVVDEATQLVHDHQAFGFPWIICHRGSDGKVEHFFGSDRMSNIAWW
ncbi:thioredoxin-like protein [Auriculariales sp. MPI-PUGE-AT-0066]|nr:thioredoxin-like protein [Auriculariales sp. MPI-PUGE-AT-0066]